VFTLLKAKKYSLVPQFLLPLLSGILLALPWLGFPGWILIGAFIPLLFSENFFSRENREFRIFTSASITFFVWNIISTAWMVSVNSTGGVLIIFINSFFMAIVFSGFSQMRRKLRGTSGYFLMIFLWLSYEYYLIHGKPGWPWLVLGNGLGSSGWLVQWYQFTGVLGGSFWVLLINILLFRFLSRKTKFETFSQLGFTMVVFLMLLLIPLVISLKLFNNKVPSDHFVSVLLVQTNIDPYTRNFEAIGMDEQLNRLIQLTEENITEGLDLIVWPETAIDSFFIADKNDQRLQSIHKLISANETSLLFGAMSFSEVQESEKYKSVLRKSDSASFVVSNSAILIGKDSLSEYRKNILVPGVETTPVFFHDVFSVGYFASLGGVSGSLYTDSTRRVLNLHDSAAIVPVICFESANGEHVAGFSPDRPFVIVNITNDGWFTREHAYNQHLLMARLRAIENNSELIRVANTGKSARIDSRGIVHESLPSGEEGTLLVKAGLKGSLSYYSLYGDFIGRIAVFFTIIAFLLVLAQFLRFKR
jgi:apolipoprotein N-acyltransferase